MINQTLSEVIGNVISQMKSAGFTANTCDGYGKILNRLKKLAEKRGEEYYSIELGQEFISDESHIIPENKQRYWHERTMAYRRCVRYIESYLKDGVIDFTPAYNAALFPINSKSLNMDFENFLEILSEKRLSKNTIDGYRRFVYYFIEFLESKEYKSTEDINPGDIVAFISVICNEKYQPTSLGAHMPALNIFLNSKESTKKFLQEVPEHLPKKRDILQVYSDDEYDKINKYLDASEKISFRNKAITLISMTTGLRAVDICGLKLSDIDWEHNCMNILQSKTGRELTLPLTNSIGNALVDYLLNERPAVESEYVFLRSVAPYNPLISHTGIRGILFNVVNDSDIEANGRSYGTRIMRHSTASKMLRNGVPLSVISETLGHNNKNSVMIYITTDDAKLAECTLPLPKGGLQ